VYDYSRYESTQAILTQAILQSANALETFAYHAPLAKGVTFV
jgi:hypothetical protein